MQQLKKLLDVDDVAEILGHGADWVYEKARQGVIPRVKLPGRAVRFRAEDIEKFIASLCEDNDR